MQRRGFIGAILAAAAAPAIVKAESLMPIFVPKREIWHPLRYRIDEGPYLEEGEPIELAQPRNEVFDYRAYHAAMLAKFAAAYGIPVERLDGSFHPGDKTRIWLTDDLPVLLKRPISGIIQPGQTKEMTRCLSNKQLQRTPKPCKP